MDVKFLKDALYGGMTANAFKLGTVLSLGWFWMRPRGCLVLYRGESIERVDMNNVLTVTASDATQMSPPVYLPHKAGSSYFYVVCRVSTCGNEGQCFNAVVKVEINASGELAEPNPNNVFDAKAERIDSDKVRLLWYYCPLLQESEPLVFKVYYDAGAGEIDYEQPLATISYGGRKFYSFWSDSLSAGKYLLAVQVEDEDGNQNTGSRPLEIKIDGEQVASVDMLKVHSI